LKPSAKKLHPFGCLAFKYIPKGKRTKLSTKSELGIFMVYDRTGFRLFMPTTGKISISRHVRFLDNIRGSILASEDDLNATKVEQPHLFKLLNEEWGEISDDIDEYLLGNPEEFMLTEQDDYTESEYETASERDMYDETENELTTQSENSNEEDLDANVSSTGDSGYSSLRRSTRISKPVTKYGFLAELQNAMNPKVHIPNSYDEAIKSKEKEHWIEAMENEINSLSSSDTWKIVDLPAGRKAIGCRWVYDIKTDIEGNIIRFKARLVAQGYKQKYMIDFDETYSPVIDYVTLRALLSIAISNQFQVKQTDYHTAYLNGVLKEIIYMKQPPGFSSSDANQVCLLHKAIYGLKQSGRTWFKTIDELIRRKGFTSSISDRCLYFKNGKEKLVVILLYVDDVLIMGRNLKEVEEIQSSITEEFKARDLGNAKIFLNWELEFTSKKLIISQTKYIRKTLDLFDIKHNQKVSTPMLPNVKLDGTDKNSDYDYRAAIGSLFYLVNCTRPDLTQSVGLLSRYQASYGESEVEQSTGYYST